MPRKSDVATVQLELPATVKRELAVRAAKEGEPVRVIVLRALASYGFDVPERELRDKRRGGET